MLIREENFIPVIDESFGMLIPIAFSLSEMLLKSRGDKLDQIRALASIACAASIRDTMSDLTKIAEPFRTPANSLSGMSSPRGVRTLCFG
jgi:hypothetical protein